MAEWIDTTLGQVVELKRGYDLAQQSRRQGLVPIVSSSGVSDYHDKAMVKGPGVVTGRYGTLGKVYFIRSHFWPLNTTLYVRNFKGNDPRFVSYFLQSIDFLSYSDKAAVPGVNRNHLHEAQVRFPRDPAEQHAIAHVLGALDDKIELKRRTNETLEAMARAIFKDWFVDFGPTRDKQEGVTGSLPSQILALFPDDLVEAYGMETPRGWERTSISTAFEINPRRSLSKGQLAPYLDMANMPTTGPSPREIIDRAVGSGMRFINGDTLVARITPCLENGKTAFVDFLKDGEVGWGSTEYIVMRAKPPLPPEYAYLVARGPEFRDYAIQQMTGSSGRQRVSADSLCNFAVVVPSAEVAIEFGKLVKPIFARIRSAAGENRSLTALRDALLPKLISGEIRVKEAERIVEAAQ